MSQLVCIDDNNYQNFLDPVIDGEKKICGSFGMFQPGQLAAGYAGEFSDLEAVPLIPESEWPDRIRQLEKDKARLPDFADDMGLRIRDQDGIPYCWNFGPCRSAEYALLQNNVPLHLSPASVGSWVSGFRKRGGWGSESLDGLRRFGCCTHEEWPQATISRRYDTQENKQAAKTRIVVEWYKLRGGRAGWSEVCSCILAGLPVAVGYSWWRHLVCATFLDLQMRLGIDNSWGERWSDNGRGLLDGARKYPDGAVVVTNVRAL